MEISEESRAKEIRAHNCRVKRLTYPLILMPIKWQLQEKCEKNQFVYILNVYTHL